MKNDKVIDLTLRVSVEKKYEEINSNCEKDLDNLKKHKKLLPQSHVEDETKSVIWNKEFIIKNNENYNTEYKKITQYYHSQLVNLEEALMNELFVENSSFTNAQLNVIYHEAYERKHSYGYSCVIQEFDELIYFLNEVKNAK